MKKIVSSLLCVLIVSALAACNAVTDGQTTPATEDERVFLTRTPITSVYGVEAPDGSENITFENGGQLASSAKKNTNVLSSQAESEMRGVWFAYVNYRDWLEGMTKAQFTSKIDEIFKNIETAGFNTVFVQVRPFGDALYQSSYFPWSRYLTGTEGKDPGYDPLEIMCQRADAHNLRIEAWLNPYRVSTDGRTLASNNQAAKWIKAKNASALTWNGGVYYNPGSAEARKLIVNGVKEIVKNYDVDGIHFDDYFYPTTDMSFDAATYQASGSKLSQADWRRENVNILVRDVYKAVKAIDPDCTFGISPQGNMSNNYDGQFIDCAKWLANPGYVDYIMPQIYYGFENGTNPFAQTVTKWNNLIKTDDVKLYVGIAAYKLGTQDQWAGAGKNEWVSTQNLLARMVETARDAEHYGGTAVYNYDSLFSSSAAQVKTEKKNLEKVFS